MGFAPILAVYGASGCGRGVLPIVRENNQEIAADSLYFVDDALAGGIVNGNHVLSFDQLADLKSEEKSISIAVADPIVREMLARKCRDAGLKFLDVYARNIVSMDDVKIGEGAIVSPFSCFTSNIRIGSHFHCNLYSYVEHDCIIGDFVTFAPGVRCNGNVKIGDYAYVGSGAMIKQGINIGKSAIIGMGAVVTQDVADNTTVVGNPARPIRK